MKKIFTFILLYCVCYLANAQTPNKFNYQTVIRDNTGAILSNQSVKLLIKLLEIQVGGTGKIIYQEEHNGLKTNEFGLVTMQIGTGIVSIGTTLDMIDWQSGNKWIETELSVNGGPFNVVGTRSQLVAVPYALQASNATTADNAKNADNAKSAETAIVAETAKNYNSIYSQKVWWENAITHSTSANDIWKETPVSVTVPETELYLLLVEGRAVNRKNVYQFYLRVNDQNGKEVEFVTGYSPLGQSGFPSGQNDGDDLLSGHNMVNLNKGDVLKSFMSPVLSNGNLTATWEMHGPQKLTIIKLAN
jgi:hypothetical protein